MTNEAKAVERRLRDRVRQIVRASPALWLEYKKARRANRPSLYNVLVTVLLLAGGMPMLFGAIPILEALSLEQKGGLDLVPAGYCLSAIGAMMLVADGVLRMTWLSSEQALYLHLPISDGAIVRTAIGSTAAASVCWFLIGAWPFGFIAWRLKCSLAESLIAVLFCLGQWLAVVASGVVLARHLPKKEWYAPAGAMMTLGGPFLLLMISGAQAHSFADALYAGTPSGWLAAAWMRGWLGANPWAWLGMLPAAAVLIESWRVWREWPARHIAAEQPTPRVSAKRQVPSHMDGVRPTFSWLQWYGWIRGDWADHDMTEAHVDVITKQIRSRAFLQTGRLFGSALLERLCRRLLPQREPMAEWIAGDWWGANNVCGGMTLLAVCMAALSAIRGVPFPCFGLLSFATLVTFFFDRWRGFRTLGSSGTAVPYYAGIPISYEELASITSKLSLIHGCQLVPGLAFAAIYDYAVSGIAARSLIAGALILLALYLAASLIRPVLFLSMTTTLWAMPWRRAHWTLAALGLGFITALGAMADFAMVAVPANPLIVQATLAMGGLVILSAYLLQRLCLFLDGRGYFDLTTAPRPSLFDRQAQQEALEARYRNRAAKRARFGFFWWLPRYMMEARQEQGL